MIVRDDLSLTDELDWLVPASATKGRSAPRRRPVAREMNNQEAVVAWIRKVIPGAVPQHVPNEAKASSASKMSRARFHQKRKKGGINKGFPDLPVPLPGGRTVYIEMKERDGTLSWDQQLMHRHLTENGHLVGVANDIDSARFLFRQWGIPLREDAREPARPAVYRLEKPKDPLNDPVPF